MAGNKHIKRYKALADLQQALSEGKITSPGIIALDDESVHYDNNLKSIYPQYVINKGDFDWESFKIYNVKPDEDTPVETIFSLDKEFYYAKLEGDSIKLNITSNKPWTCTYDSTYCSVSSSSGNGNKSITITVFLANSSHDINIDFYIEDKKVAIFPIYQYIYKGEYLTFDIKSDGNITWKRGSSSTSAKTISYSKNNGTWTDITSTTSGVSISVVTGDKVRFKGSNSVYATSQSNSSSNSFGGTATFDVYGNIMSLIGGDNFSNLNTLSSTYTFAYLFYNCTGLLSSENLILPATTLTYGCYCYMFSFCENLTTAPSLLATTLAYECYCSMFSGCTSLTTAPELPATTLSGHCYGGMFRCCTSLTTAPELPVTTLTNWCYGYMFEGCTSLTTAPELPATTLTNWCYCGMFSGCTSLTTAPELPATTLANYCYQYMFSGCTSLILAPELPATTLVSYCYSSMFNGCTNLNYIKCLATNISAVSCTMNWVNGVAISGTFVKSPTMTGWATGNDSIPSGWTIEDDYTNEYLTFDIKSGGNITWKMNSSSAPLKTISYSKNNGTWTDITSTTSGVSISVVTGDKVRFKGSNSVYATGYSYSNSFGGTATFDIYGNIMSLIDGDNFSNLTTLSYHTFACLFSNCSGLLSSENLILPATTLANYCYESMFRGCTSLTTAPELPATTLAESCYFNMFYGCTSLTTAPELPATTLTYGCYWYMFGSCTSLTSSPELPATTLANMCYSSMFSDCASLTTAPELSATTLAQSCYSNMFYGCTSLTTAPELPATTLTEGCYAYMFYRCTSLTSAPELPATTLANYCYNSMFYICSQLNYIKCLATNISASDCIFDWVYGVAATGTFVKAPTMTGWKTGNDGIPSRWTIEDDYTNEYLTFDIKSDGNITWKMGSSSAPPKTISYSKNNGTWTDITSTTSGVSISVVTGDKVRFKGSNSAYATPFTYNSFGGTATFDVYGNIMSLIGGDNFSNLNTLSSTYTFALLFQDYTGLTSAENIILPATTLTEGCYNSMFRGCTSLISVPKLLATTLANNCYSSMFSGCTSLTTAPELPATTLSSSCYASMFQGCNSLITLPELPATTLSNYCYQNMFSACTSLTTAPELPATTLADHCYYFMFNGCTSLTTAPELLATTLANYCYSGMFYGCTSLTSAPELPATTLASNCYSNMFAGCTNLNYIKCLATDISAYDCTYNWVNGVAISGTFVKVANTDWNGKTSNNGIPSAWTVQDAA